MRTELQIIRSTHSKPSPHNTMWKTVPLYLLPITLLNAEIIIKIPSLQKLAVNF